MSTVGIVGSIVGIVGSTAGSAVGSTGGIVSLRTDSFRSLCLSHASAATTVSGLPLASTVSVAGLLITKFRSWSTQHSARSFGAPSFNLVNPVQQEAEQL